MIDKSKEDLDYYANFIENGQEKIDEMKDDLLNQFEFWDIITGEDNPFQKIKAMEDSPLYLKYLCKLIKRTIEKNQVENFSELFETI